MSDITKLDLGCGSNKRAGYYGIDIHSYEGVDEVMDLRFAELPFEDNSLEHVFASHFLEHLTFEENIFIFNEVYRTLKSDMVFEIVVPHGMSYAGITDLSHKTFWTEDTFGYFTPANRYFYDWIAKVGGKDHKLINRWEILKNDTTPPKKWEYTKDGWTEVEVKLREVHAYMKKLP